MAVRTVGIVSPGDMGAAIGNVLRHHGLDVVTCLDGRSDLTRTRATESGMRDVGTLNAVLDSCDLLLSVLVPAEAVPIAQAVADAMRRTGAKPAYVECNAIAPQTVVHIGDLIGGAGALFIDAGIIGTPPRPERKSTRIYCSGPDTELFESLAEHGLDVRRVGPTIGQASGLKMVYAASTKGTSALWTELMVAARALDLDDALMAEFAIGNVEVNNRLVGGIPDMPRRAAGGSARWRRSRSPLATWASRPRSSRARPTCSGS